ncbi:hypothetical protein [Endozoicomonas elysicola]|uniref:Replication initiation factor n=1 Tax=Endozoicomonas elysicola TaxID=305900 RepID=A0A081KB99_9GAMM|nr:hypothetical protein [Endozoicomonas elysicola]KEI71425.1 hypothetical protein GV64_12355 [Endozoicomonas elysicola]
MKHLERYEPSEDGKTTNQQDKGLLFVHPKFGKVKDLYLENFQIVGTYVDTLRQLFKGAMNLDFLTDIEDSLSFGEKTFRFVGHDWILGKSGKASGYQYRLQNNQLGVIIFCKMFHSRAESIGSHLKIECSPWFLDNRSPKKVDQFLANIAKMILRCAEPHYPAIHLAVDVQGWKPDNDLSERMTCKSRRVSNYFGIDKAEFTVSDVSCVYDRAQSFKFGSAGAVQLAIYNKTIQARDFDKFDYMEHKWQESTQLDDGSSGYDPESDVFRFEVRFHHSVIQQFALGTCNKETGEIGVKMNTYTEVIKHIQALWQYGLRSFKLKYNSNYLDPIWTILLEDIVFKYPESAYKDNLHYKRYYKKATSFSGKNYQLYIGNLLSACARKGLKFKRVLRELQGSVIWDDIAQHYEKKNTTENQLIERLRESYQERILMGYSI